MTDGKFALITNFTNRTAGDREAGARCPHCSAAIANGEQIAACVRCGAVHHILCWQSHDGCGSFDCAPARRILGEDRPAGTADHRRRGRPSPPPPRPVIVPASYFPGMRRVGHDPLQPRRWSRLAIAAMIVGVAGIPLVWRRDGLSPSSWAAWPWAESIIPASAARGLP